MGCMGWSLCEWRDKQLHAWFRWCGLEKRSLQVDTETLISCWAPKQEDDNKNSSNNKKPALVLLQGFGTSPVWQWFPQIQPLSSSFRLFLPDLLFFASSSSSSPSRSELFQATSISRAMASLGVPRFSVLGTSYGGFVAFRLAHLFPDSVDRVILANSGVCLTPQDNAALLRRAHVDSLSELLLPQSPAALRTLLGLSMFRPPSFLPSFVLRDLIDYFYVENRAEREELLDGLLLGREDAEPLPGLRQKVLIIWGEHDGIFPPELAHRLKGHLGEKAELVIVKNTAHCVQLENPKEFNKLVEIFLLSDGP